MRLTWRLAFVRVLAYSLLAFQVVQGVGARESLSPYMKSYWLVTYEHGFVRRGLTGAVLRPFGVPDSTTIVGAAWFTALITVVAVIVLMELLFRARTPRTCALGVLLACSPFLVDYSVYQRRPDLIGLPVLVVLGVVLLSSRRMLTPLIVAVGVLFGLGVLVHEATATYALPWALVMIAVMAPRRLEAPARPARLVRLMVVVALPAFLAFVAVGVWGQASTSTIKELRSDASFLKVGTRPNGTPKVTAFDFLSDDASTALDRVQAIPRSVKLGDLMLATILIGMQAAWLWWWARPRLWKRLVAAGTPVAVLCLAAVFVGTVTLFATGIDWLRWVALIGGSWLITCGFALLAEEPEPERPDRVEVPTLLPFAAVYLAALAPMNALTQLSGAVRTLLLR